MVFAFEQGGAAFPLSLFSLAETTERCTHPQLSWGYLRKKGAGQKAGAALATLPAQSYWRVKEREREPSTQTLLTSCPKGLVRSWDLECFSFVLLITVWWLIQSVSPITREHSLLQKSFKEPKPPVAPHFIVMSNRRLYRVMLESGLCPLFIVWFHLPVSEGKHQEKQNSGTDTALHLKLGCP